MPFYRVDADAVTQWTGRDKVEVKSATEKEPAEYEYKDRSGSHSETYKDFIEVTKGLDQGEVDRIQPFDDNETKPYSQELMQGYKFEKPDMKRHNAEEKARDRMKKNEEQACSSYADEIRSTSTTISNLRSKLMMLPIWILVYIYKEKAFRVLINGQTGKIAGKKPKSGLKIFLFLLIIAAVIAGVVVLVRLLGN